MPANVPRDSLEGRKEEALKKHLKASKEHFEDLEKPQQRSANTKGMLRDFQMPSKGLLQTLHISSKGLVRP